ncbi:unnamed protein product, partial [Cyprideis torosa]
MEDKQFDSHEEELDHLNEPLSQSEDGLEATEEEGSQEELTESGEGKSIDLQQALEEEKDKYLRLYAEFDNFKRRTAKERLDLLKTAGKDLIIDLLPVLDDMDRAYLEMKKTNQPELLKGIELIRNKLNHALEEHGLARIEVEKGEALDTDKHEAITTIPAPDESLKNKIIDTIETGYTLNDKVIRFAKVVLDKNPDDPQAEERFKEAAQAYEVLSDPNKRSRYDQFGHAGVGGAGGAGGGMNMEDIFSQFGDIFGGAFGGGFGGGFGQSRRTVKGSDLRIRVKVNLTDMLNGVEKKIKVTRLRLADGATFKTCSQCNGRGSITQVQRTILGHMQTTAACPSCRGVGKIADHIPAGANNEGLIKKDETISIKIPAGVRDGISLQMRGKGNDGPAGGVSGDLIIMIEELEDEHLKRDGNNLHYLMHISLPEAILGVSKEVPTINGKAKINIEAGVQSGKTLRLKGKGLPDIDGYEQGDLFVHIDVWIPKKLSKKELAFFKENLDNPDFDPKPNSQERSFFDK